MRVGIISDIHSNVEALRAVLQEFEDRHVEKIICLGDIIGLGSRPDECVALLQENSDKILCAVRGNHENYLLKELPVHNHGDKTKANLVKAIEARMDGYEVMPMAEAAPRGDLCA